MKSMHDPIQVTLELSPSQIIEAMYAGVPLRFTLSPATLADTRREGNLQPVSTAMRKPYRGDTNAPEWYGRFVRVVRPKAINQYRVGSIRHACFMASAGGEPITLGGLHKQVGGEESTIRSTINMLTRKGHFAWVNPEE